MSRIANDYRRILYKSLSSNNINIQTDDPIADFCLNNCPHIKDDCNGNECNELKKFKEKIKYDSRKKNSN